MLLYWDLKLVLCEGCVCVASPAIPSLVEEPVDTVAGYNGVDGLILSATLRCQGNPRELEISWYKDDQEINMAGIPYFNVSDGWLTVGTRDRSDDLAALEGFYFCTVSNSLGTVRSRKALIKGVEALECLIVCSRECVSFM